MINGLDLLGAAKYQELAYREFPKDWALGVFAETFGDSYPLAERLAKEGRCKAIRVHLIWSDTHQFGDKDIPKIKKLSKKWNQLAKHTQLLISPFCEHNLPNAHKYLDIAKQEAPESVIINTPMNNTFSGVYRSEHHGTKAEPASIFSFDGDDASNADVENLKEKHRNGDIFFYWSPRFNLRWNEKDTTPRPKRTAYPNSNDIDHYIFLSTIKGKTTLPRKWICKPRAEKHNKEDNKGDKLLIISPIKDKEIALVCESGQVVDVLKYYGTYSEGGYRYYSQNYGFLIAQKAKRIQGGYPVVAVKIKGKTYGFVNPGFRENAYR